MTMQILQTLRRIRACEGEVAAQLVLEAYAAQEVAAERERCAKLCDDYGFTRDDWRDRDVAEKCAGLIRAI